LILIKVITRISIAVNLSGNIKRFNSDKNSLTLFEENLKRRGIVHKLIRPFMPRHNGKVERSHRKDNECFYATHTFYSFDGYKIQPAIHNRKYYNFPMRSIKWLSLKEVLLNFLNYGVTYH
jgi:hypothetical protein